MASQTVPGPNGERARVIFRDRSKPHQIVVWKRQGDGLAISVSCHCLASRNGNGSVRHKPIGTRGLWEPGQVQDAWRQWHEDQDIALAE